MMSSEVVVAVLSLVGTLLGSMFGILGANKLISYRLDKLEKKVDLHNNAVERLFVVEGKLVELEHDIRDLKGVRK